MDNRPIGLFDSGFGGLTVARALIDLMRDENMVYVGDTLRYPYGSKPLADVAKFSHQIAEWLVETHNVKALVVACNTAAAAALDELQARFDIPVIGVIDPGVRAALKATRTGRVGVIGTVGTIQSEAYQREFLRVRPEIELTALGCPGFVEFVERGEFRSQQAQVLAERLLAPAVEAGVDTLLLGCTHYPYLARTIGEVMGRDVVLVSSADETAFQLRDLTTLGGIGAAASYASQGSPEAASPGSLEASRQFFTTGDVEWFRLLGSQLLGPELARAAHLELG